MSQPDLPAVAEAVFQSLHRALAAEPRTREPLNALVVWTELGKGLAGTLGQVGGDPGWLREMIAGWCREQGGRPGADLSKWGYRLAPEERLAVPEVAAAVRRIQSALEDDLPAFTAAAQADNEARRALYLAIIRGWFPVGLDIVRSMPAGRAASREQQLSALSAWCERYLPAAGGSPAELGIRVER